MFNMSVYYSDELRRISHSDGISEEEREAINDELALRKKDKTREPSSGTTSQDEPAPKSKSSRRKSSK